MIEKGDIVISYSNVYVYLRSIENTMGVIYDYLYIAEFNSTFTDVSLSTLRTYELRDDKLSDTEILELSKFLFKTKKYMEVSSAIEYHDVPNKLINIRERNLKWLLE